ncbi:MAG: hypothetical protein Q4E31_11625 [Intestinibacter bartlettii]|uniref:hypothetical protein n=1 Tax=Intestinibacter bartlettii TaxID=261299 RepID=UPI0026EA1D39|nr:hypothetical protein [Intestinibacter bartlettii]MDO5011467.1 hypothetical protein [Intestinibacter bartlettii]
MERIISNNFVGDLEDGILRNILKYVKSDTTLAMEIRKDCINIYYRGGSLLKIKEVGENIYNGYFDKNYIKTENSQSVVVECIPGINNLSKANKLIEYIPKIKQQMDLWMKIEMPDGGEREYKHIVAKENNYGLIGKESDYFIGDIEYRGCLNNYLFDMIGVKWAVDNDNTKNLDLALFKMYYGDKHLKTSKEILNDLNNITSFLNNKEYVNVLKNDLKEIYKVKSMLGLLYPYKELEINFSQKIEIVYIFGNQSNENENLKNTLINIKTSQEYEKISQIVDIKVATASFMGYGLYEKNMVTLDKAIEML